MASGVGICLIRNGSRLIRRSNSRSFSSAFSRHNQGGEHHTYFRHDSPIIHYPRSQNSSESDAGWSYDASSSRIRELADGQKWLIFFGGFITFPLVCLGYYWGDWAFGTKLWKSDVKDLEEKGLGDGSRGLLKSTQDQFMDANNLYHILQRANAETKALHDLVLLWINPGIGLHAVRDTAFLKQNPIKMSNGRQLDSGKAILIRILDNQSKTVVLLLGVDMTGHNGSESDPSLAWCHDYALRGWMDDRAEQLKQRGEAADRGISLYCYTPTSSATSLPGKKGEMWQEARLFPEDLPNGFPLKSLEAVKDEMNKDVP